MTSGFAAKVAALVTDNASNAMLGNSPGRQGALHWRKSGVHLEMHSSHPQSCGPSWVHLPFRPLEDFEADVTKLRSSTKDLATLKCCS